MVTYQRGHLHVRRKGRDTQERHRRAESPLLVGEAQTPRQIHPHADLLSSEGYTAHHPVSLGCPCGTWTGDAYISADRSLLGLAGIYSARRRPGGEGGMIP